MATPEKETEWKFEPPFGAIIASIIGIVAWLVFIVLYALDWSKNYDFFQNAIVTIASLLITGLAIGAIWMIWFRMNGGVPREWKNKRDERSQFQNRRRTRNEEILDAGQRAGEIVSVTIVLLILGFYLYHQIENTGFFTPSFNGWEMFALYGSIILSLVPPLARAAIGRRNPVRPIEAFGNLFFAFATLWLLLVFPFNFAHFSAALPVQTRSLFFWLTNDIARFALVLAIPASFTSAVYNIVRYITFTPAERTSSTIEQSNIQRTARGPE